MVSAWAAPTDVVSARVVEGFVVDVLFGDGLQGSVDLRSLMAGPIFDEITRTGQFTELRVDPELGTITWPNGADLAPDVIREQIVHSASRRLPSARELQQELVRAVRKSGVRRSAPVSTTSRRVAPSRARVVRFNRKRQAIGQVVRSTGSFSSKMSSRVAATR